jgi:Type VI secretion system/phage-baseplate injector OB domain
MDPELLAQLLDWIKSRHFGKYRGKVASNQDPTKRGRLKVQVPAVLDTLEVWAMPCVPYAGEGVGFFAMPPEQSGVWVEFEAGDPSYPIWSGCFWADDEVPLGGEPDLKVWKTDGLTLSLDDQASEATLKNDSASITLSDSVETVASSGKHTVSADGVVSEAGGKGKVEVTSSMVDVNSGGIQVS